MKLYLVPFNAEAKVLTSILPNCRKVSNSLFQNRWEYKGGEIISWNEAGTETLKKVIFKIGNFDNYSSVILFGSVGALAPDLKLGDVYSVTTIKDIENNSWLMPEIKGIKPNSLLTTNELVFNNDLRNKYYQKYNCNLVDMESSIFAKLSCEGFFKNIDTYIIRFISDNYETIPPLNESKSSSWKGFLSKANVELSKYRKLLI